MKGMVSPHQRAAGLISANLWTTIPGMFGSIEQTLGRADEALKFGNESLRRAHQLKHFFSIATALHAVCLLHYERRQPEATRELAEAGIALAHERGFREFLMAGKALGVLEEELAGIERSGAHREAAEHRRLKAEALLVCNSSATAEAEACFRKAIQTVRGQSAKWWELRATVSLARLLRDAGRRDEARAMLPEVYNWFTEGFDTPDLKDTKTLLDELQS